MLPLGKSVRANAPTRCPGFREKIGVCGKGVRQGREEKILTASREKIGSVLLNSVTWSLCGISLHWSLRLGFTVFSIRLWVQLPGYLKEKGKSGKRISARMWLPLLKEELRISSLSLIVKGKFHLIYFSCTINFLFFVALGVRRRPHLRRLHSH